MGNSVVTVRAGRTAVILALVSVLASCSSPPESAPSTEESTSPPAATPTDPTERIAFGRWGADQNRGVPPQIWTANADGGDMRQVGDQHGWYLEWSPDRTHLLFDFLDPDGNAQIGRVNVDGSGYAQLTSGVGFFADPAYSPDGTVIAFTYGAVPEEDPNFEASVWLMNADGSNQRPLLSPEDSGMDWEPVFSPDGSRVVFQRDQQSGDALTSAIFVVNKDGTGLQQITAYEDYEEHPRWSPDGTTIIYNVHPRDGDIERDNVGIWTVPAVGGTPLMLFATNDKLHGFKPNYSPDGTRILFGCAHISGGNEDLCMMNADGSDVRVLKETPEYENFGIWF